MKNTKYYTFINELLGVLSHTNPTSIKRSIGDSVDNNRTPSVNQVVRFLNKRSNRRLAGNLRTVFNKLKSDIKFNRAINTNRTDAFDVYEFTNAYINTVLLNDINRRSVSQLIK